MFRNLIAVTTLAFFSFTSDVNAEQWLTETQLEAAIAKEQRQKRVSFSSVMIPMTLPSLNVMYSRLKPVAVERRYDIDPASYNEIIDDLYHRGSLNRLGREHFPNRYNQRVECDNWDNLDIEARHALVSVYAKAKNIDPNYFVALIYHESAGYNRKARSSVGAKGLGQFMPATAKLYNVVDPYDACQALTGASQFYYDMLVHPEYIKASELYFQYGFKTRHDYLNCLVLAGYNSGQNRIPKLGRLPNIKETNIHRKRILAHMVRFRNSNKF